MQYSIVYKNELDQTATRLDAEYYHPENLQKLAILKSKPYQQIGEFSWVLDGIHASIDFDEESDILVLSAKAPKENFFDLSGLGKISKEQDDKNKRTRLKVDDVIVSSVGTIGNCAVVDKALLPANADRHVGIIRIKNGFRPRFLSTFLLSKFGRFQTLREATGNVQLNLFVYKIQEIVVPELTPEFQALIENSVVYAHQLLDDSKSLYRQAEERLLEELGLRDWRPQHALSFVSNYAKAQEAERWDAEYYHPEKYHYLNQLANLPGETISHHFKAVRDMLDPTRVTTNEPVYNYDLTDALRFFLDDDVQSVPTNELGSNKKRFRKGDLVVSRLRSYLKEIAIVDTPSGKCVGSSEFIVFRSRSNKIKAELLLVYLRSQPVQSILKWCQNGSNHPRFDEKELLGLKFPDALFNIQDEVVETVQKGLDAHRTSKQLLEIAKRAVEIAIEQDEQAADAWLKAETDKLGVEINI